MFHELLIALEETIFMVFTAGLLTLMLGLPLGIALSLLKSKQMSIGKKMLYRGLKASITLAATLPYLVLVILMVPLLRTLFGSEEGVLAAILPLSFATVFPFAAYVEETLKTPKGYEDLARSLGAERSTWVMKVGLKEGFPKLFQYYASLFNQLVGYSVIAGVFGAGGLGGLLIVKGYQNFHIVYVLATIGLLMLVIQGIRFSLQYLNHGQSH